MWSQVGQKVWHHWQRTAAQLPSQCAVCHAWPAQRVCNDCVARFAQPRPRCPTCAMPLAQATVRCGECLSRPPLLDGCVAAVDYGFPWSGVLSGFKFHGDPSWANALALLIRSTPWAEPALEAAGLVLPLPLSPQRLRQRGFNQSLLLARHLAPEKTDATLLLRLHHTPAQSSLGRAQRLLNLEGAFALEPTRASAVRGQRIVLVDDVMTTGATLHSAAAVLRQAGAAHVSALVVARTRTPDLDSDECMAL
ncbi:MAG: ComF family protein [Burkholderiaceae bacterium]|nr:ComF family protein [Burkholderiaceae bacterium]